MQRFQKVPVHKPLLTLAYINPSCLSLFNLLGSIHRAFGRSYPGCGQEVTASSRKLVSRHFAGNLSGKAGLGAVQDHPPKRGSCMKRYLLAAAAATAIAAPAQARDHQPYVGIE